MVPSLTVSGGPKNGTTFNKSQISIKAAEPHETSYQTTSTLFNSAYKFSIESIDLIINIIIKSMIESDKKL